MKEFSKINKESLSNRIILSRLIFLKGLSFLYLITFISLYGQIQGLWGNDGLLPSNLFLQKIQEGLKDHKYYLLYPTLAWLLNIQSSAIENYLYIICLIGIILSLLIIFYPKNFCNSFSFFALWYIHYNFIILGQIFMKFASDSLLSEIGFITIFFAPINFRYINYIFIQNNISFYILKFILFKFMVSTGINIVGSQCPYWTSFTGLSFFFQGQILLSSNSYFFHNYLSDNTKKILSAFGYFCILYLPSGYFLIWRRFAIYAGQITFLFNLFLIFVGNYGTLNLLVIILNVLNFDDYFIRCIFSVSFLKNYGIDYISYLIPLYIKESKENKEKINKYEEELEKIRDEIDKKSDKNLKDKNEKEIKELTGKYNDLRKQIIELDESELDDEPKIETTFIIESSLMKECFIFINFLCANLLFVYIILYPIKRLIKGITVLEQVSTQNFKFTIIIISILVFIYITVVIVSNLVSKLKTSIFSEKSLMDSLLKDMIENNKKNKDKNNINNIKDSDSLIRGIKKPSCIKIINMAVINLFKMSKYIIFMIIFGFYYLGSMRHFLLNIDVELYPEKESSPAESNSEKFKHEETPGLFQNLFAISDLFFSNYYVYGIYGNTQKEIQSVLGRSELEIEYMTEVDNKSWKAINFDYKLGPKNSEPKFLFFYTPRIDMKLNEVANDEDLNKDSWIILLLGKIFERNHVVLDLMGYEIEEKKFLEKISFYEKMKRSYFGRKKYEIMPMINKLKIDIFKYQFLKNVKNKGDPIFKRKRYKEYLSPIEKHTLVMVYEKLGLPKPDPNKKIKINKFQYIPVVDIVIIFILIIFLIH